MDLGHGGRAARSADSYQVELGRALAAAQIAAWHWDRDTGLHWSADAAEALGVPEIVLRSPELLDRALDPGDMAVAARAVRRAWRYGGSVNARIRGWFSGEYRWFDVVGRVQLDEAGHPTGAIGVAFDVTGDREAGEAILEALGDAELTLDRLMAASGEWDPAGDTVTIARQPPGLTLVESAPGGVPLEEFLARAGTRDAGRVRQALWEALDQGRAVTLEFLFRDDDGDLRPALLRAGPASCPAERVWLAVTLLNSV